jgi:hypothetical protein
MRALLMRALLLPLLLGSALAPRAQTLSLDALPRYVAPPAERGPVVPAAVQRWRDEAKQLEHGDGDLPRDPQRAASLYCRAARFGDAEAQFSLAWMLTNGTRHRARRRAGRAPLPAAAEQGHAAGAEHDAAPGHAAGEPPPCLRPPDGEEPPAPKAKPVLA